MTTAQRTAQPQNNAVVAAYGRNYARFALEQKIHCVPVDDDEEQNYDSVNDILRQLLGGPVRGVILPRMRLSSDAEVLDCGYGKGAWIDSVLNLSPDALMVEFHSMFQSSTGRPTVFLQDWWNRYARILQVTRKDPRVGPRLRQLMADAGFVDIQYHQIPCPMGAWDEDRAVLGRQALPVCQEMLRDVSEYLFKAVGRMEASEFDRLIEGAQEELARPELRIYLNVHVCIGRKASRRR
ncbi:hypothetical protein HII31_03433 [Pseudocercospora fuligena]|uniref:Methyltransferase n=1 Tax=Pseudocercospora fuligena TaxID=685502 RepID=A0A8H6RQ86_9PEZI|nr:hypothetical protein HII31_03433 [Pseudocercospora fuligena]